MQSFAKLLAIYFVVGHSPFGAALPAEERSRRSSTAHETLTNADDELAACELTDTVRLSLRDLTFAAEWQKQCAFPEIVDQTFEKRGGSLSGYGSDTTTSTPSSTKDSTTAASSSNTPGSSGGYGGSSSTSTTAKASTTYVYHILHALSHTHGTIARANLRQYPPALYLRQLQRRRMF